MRHILIGIALGAVLLCGLPAAAALKVITATTDFADIARRVGGNHVQVESLAGGDQDLHHVDPRPSYVTKLANADAVVRIGMNLDLWMDALLQAARNRKVSPGGAGYVDASKGVTIIGVPTEKLDPSKGDIHAYGNPHYWLDPVNGRGIGYSIMLGFVRVDPAHADDYKRNYNAFAKALDDRIAGWKKQMVPLNGACVVQYHTTYDYLYNRFGLKCVGSLESKPGIPPSAAHIRGVIGTMKQNGVKLVMTCPYYSMRFTDMLQQQTGAAILILPSSVGGDKTATDYFALFDTLITRLVAGK